MDTCLCLSNLGGAVNENYTGIFKLLHCLLLRDEKTKDERIRILKVEYGIDIDEDMEGAMGDMCTYGEWVAYDAVEKGIKKGITQTMLSAIRSLMKSMNWNCEEAMDKLNVPQEDRGTYGEMIEK